MAIKCLGLPKTAGPPATNPLKPPREFPDLIRGNRVVPRETEAQTLSPNETRGLSPASPYALCRHPLNFFPVPLLWLNPRMTTKLAAFNAVSTIYFYLGSLHSDHRLKAQFGPEFDEYRARVPLFVPRLPTFSRKNRPIRLFQTSELLENIGKDR